MKLQYFILGLVGLVMVSCSRPTAKFQTAQKSYTAPVDIKFDNYSQNADSYLWDFGDGTTSTDSTPTHHYYHSGNYKVSLTAMKNGKKKTMTENIHVKAPTDCLVEIMTSEGNIVIHLFDDTPGHQENFLKLAEEGFYDSLLFHRVIPGFMIQGGDPSSREAPPTIGLGSGGPGYQIPHEIMDEHIHVKGALAAARTNNPEKKSSGSQFYIVDGRDVNDNSLVSAMSNRTKPYSPEQKEAYYEKGGTPALDGLYTVFGQVVSGLDVVEKIARVDRDRRDRPKEDVWMVVKVVK